jgi:serine phosphatase RsbU (regulator of sigma subunit)
LKCMIESSEIYQKLGNNVGIAKCLGGIGNIYYFMNELPKAKEYYEKALDLYKKEGNDFGIASCLNNLGLICHQTNDFKKSLEYQLEGLKLEEKSGNKRGIAISHISIASLLLDLKKFSEAKEHAKIAIKIAKSIADTNSTSDGIVRLAESYRFSKQYDSAQLYISEAIRISEKIKDYHQLKYALEIQIAIFDSLGYYQNAYKSNVRLMEVKDSLLNKDKSAQLIEMQTKFDSEQKQKENEILLTKNFNQKLILWGLVAIIALTLMLVIQILLSKRKLRASHENLLGLHQELQQHKEEIETQAESLIKANEAILRQKDQLEHTHQKIADSIVYASFIQSALLPSEDEISKFAKDSFIIYEPRDVVSGDFYWVKERDEKFVVAVADCTGHGVPGALLSMMGISFLNDIVVNISELNPSNILENLRENVKQALGQYSNKSLRKEGIEIGLFVYNSITKKLSFSGAYISLWVLRKGIIKEYKADRMSIGISLKESPFSQTEIDINEGDTIYLFTDGYSDQLGGKTRKKFLRKNLVQELVATTNFSLNEQKHHLSKVHKNWRGDKYEQIDDILVMAIRF